MCTVGLGCSVLERLFTCCDETTRTVVVGLPVHCAYNVYNKFARSLLLCTIMHTLRILWIQDEMATKLTAAFHRRRYYSVVTLTIPLQCYVLLESFENLESLSLVDNFDLDNLWHTFYTNLRHPYPKIKELRGIEFEDQAPVIRTEDWIACFEDVSSVNRALEFHLRNASAAKILPKCPSYTSYGL